jgi:hypothetical protein
VTYIIQYANSTVAPNTTVITSQLSSSNFTVSFKQNLISAAAATNNSNIISVAEQAAQLANDNATTSRVYVLPTKGIQEALAALVDFDPMASGEENLVRMKEASESVKAGEITVAIRDSSFDQGAIAKGDYIGIARGQGIVVAEKELSAAVIGLTEFLLENTSELVTLIEGLDYDESSSRGLKDWLEENRPEVTLERLKGGQPIYSYLISVE